jgi:general secretion pathway protein J
MKSIRKTSDGFTLVEMLVAISLLGLLGVISWRGLDQVIKQRERVNEETANIERVIRTIAQIERDIDQRVADVLMVAPSDVSVLPYSMDIAVQSDKNQRVSIFRTFPQSPGGQTVTYYLRTSDLMRTVSVESTGASTSVAMLSEVREFHTRYLLGGGWVTADALNATPGERARAIEIAIERASGERYVRVLPL